VRQAKLNFVRLQAANDRRDLNLLREVTTDKMYEAIVATMPAREGEQQTDVLGLDANLLEVVPQGDGYRASVRFQGTVRDQGQQATRFDEVWHLYKPASGQSGWLLAGIDQMA
jgi:predicted lipid-binding transport protein (Tim44 family)